MGWRGKKQIWGEVIGYLLSVIGYLLSVNG